LISGWKWRGQSGMRGMDLAVDPLSLDFGRNKPWCVYIYRDPRRGQRRAPIYVGKGQTRNRPEAHWNHGSHNKQLERTLGEIREAGLQPIIELVGFFDSESDALALEKELIARYSRSADAALCNIQPGSRQITQRPPKSPYTRFISRAQLRGARAALGWSIKELATRAKLSGASIQRAEAGEVREGSLLVIERAFRELGVVFLDENEASPGGGRGFRLKLQSSEDEA